MSKETLKASIAVDQSNLDPFTGESLPIHPSLIDTDRIIPKADGGTYDDRDNVRVLDPLSHMERHGTLRTRVDSLDNLKTLFDDRVQTIKLRNKINNQLLAYKRRVDNPNQSTVQFLESNVAAVQTRLNQIDKELTAAIKQHDDLLAKTALNVPGLGPITVAALIVYVDLEKAQHVSSLWKYVGLHCASHERYKKGQAGGGNKTLRTVLWNTATVMVKMGDRSPYRIVYDRAKSRLEQSERIVKSRNTQGREVEVAWKDTKPSHRHGAALRAVMKHILADYWYVGRMLRGLTVTPMYVHEHLGHTDVVSPFERGWFS